MTFVTHNKVNIAWKRFHEVTGAPKDLGGYVFWRFIGELDHPPRRDDWRADWLLCQESADRIEAINGPHYIAVIKAIEAKRCLK